MKVVTTDPPDGAEPFDIGIGKNVKGYILGRSKSYLEE